MVHGSRTATGAPLLAGDPHIPFNIPGAYTAHLSAPNFAVIGASSVGTPFFIGGHNERIAWGVTCVGADVIDLFVEKIRADSPSSVPHVRTVHGWQPLTIRREEFHVRGQTEPVVHQVRSSSHGPLISDAFPDWLQLAGLQQEDETHSPSYALASAFSVLQPVAPRWGFGLIRAQNWTDFRQAFHDYAGTDLNFVYADVDGHIGYQLAARIPRREGPAPMAPIPGWEPGHEWIGTVPFEALPHLFDPPDGIIATANAWITDTQYPHYLASRWDSLPTRIERIRELLAQHQPLTIDDFAAIQLDVYQSDMADIMSWVGAVQSTDAEVEWFQHLLTTWDQRAEIDSTPSLLAEAFRLELIQQVFGSRLPPELFDFYRQWWGDFQFLALKNIMEDERASFFHSQPGQAHSRRTATVERAIHRAIQRLEAALGTNRLSWSWGQLHTLTFPHPFSRAPGLLGDIWGWLMNVGPFPAPGSLSTVNLSHWDSTQPFTVQAGPQYRQIIDLGDFSRSRFLPAVPGQSGHRASPHYDDLAQPWLKGQYFPMLWTREQIEADAEVTLRLVPAERDGEKTRIPL